MIEKSLIVFIFMYSTSFGILGAQYALADTFGIELTNWKGEVLQNPILIIINVADLNLQTENVTSTDPAEITGDPIGAAGKMTLQLFLILTGTYIFNVLYFLGVPIIIVSGLILLYLILLARTFIAYLRGI